MGTGAGVGSNHVCTRETCGECSSSHSSRCRCCHGHRCSISSKATIIVHHSHSSTHTHVLSVCSTAHLPSAEPGTSQLSCVVSSRLVMFGWVDDGRAVSATVSAAVTSSAQYRTDGEKERETVMTGTERVHFVLCRCISSHLNWRNWWLWLCLWLCICSRTHP